MRRSHRRALSLGLGLTALAALAVALSDEPGARPGARPARTAEGRAGDEAPGGLRARPNSVAAPPVLVAFRAPGEVGVDVVGFDPEAPRELVLWSRPSSGAARVVGTARSRTDGRFAATGLMVGVAPTELVATAPGAAPQREHGPGAALVPGGPAREPVAWSEGRDLVVALSRQDQQLRVARADGREVARLRLPRSPRPGAVWRQAEAEIGGGPIAWIARDPSSGPARWSAVPRRSQAPLSAAALPDAFHSDARFHAFDPPAFESGSDSHTLEENP